MAQTAPRPRPDTPAETTPHADPVNPVTAGATDALQRQSRDLLDSGSGGNSGLRSGLATLIQSGYNAAAMALESKEVQAMLAGVIIGGLPTVKTTDGSATGPKTIPDSPPGGVIRQGDTTGSGGPRVVRDDGRGMVRPETIRRPHDLPPHNPDGGMDAGHTVKFPTGELGSLIKPGKGSESGDGPAPSHIPGSDIMSKEFKEGVIKRYQQLSALITGIAEGLTDGSVKSKVDSAAEEAETEAETPAEDPLADGVLDIPEAFDLFVEADLADAERQQKVDKLLENIPAGPVRDLMREASSQLLDSAQLDTEKIQKMLKDAKAALGDSKFYSQMGDVMTKFSRQFSEQFGIGLTLNRAENENGDMQDAILVSQRTGSGRDNGKLTIMAIPETGAPQVTQSVTTISGTRVGRVSDDPEVLFNTFGNTALQYYFDRQ